MFVIVFLVMIVMLDLSLGQAALGQLCWSREAGVMKEGCAEGTVCQPWNIGTVGFYQFFGSDRSSRNANVHHTLSMQHKLVKSTSLSLSTLSKLRRTVL